MNKKDTEDTIRILACLAAGLAFVLFLILKDGVK